MSIKRINSVRVAPAIGPYSHASIVEKTIYLSGQLGLDNQGNLVSGGVEKELLQVFVNIQKILEDCQSSLDNVIKATIFLKEMKNFAKVNEIYILTLQNPDQQEAVSKSVVCLRMLK